MGETTRDLENGISAIPKGEQATGTLTQDSVVEGVLLGTGTKFRTEFAKPRLFLFFPDTTPPYLLKVKDFNAADYDSQGNIVGQDIVYVENPPALASIVGQSFQVVQATLKAWGVYNKGTSTAQFDGAIGGTGTTLEPGQTEASQESHKTQNSPYDPKDAHWVDATGAGNIVEIYEQP